LSDRLSFWIAVLLLVLAAVLRLQELSTVPYGFADNEITNIRIAETARSGIIEVFYDLGDEGREGFYQILTVFSTAVTGDGVFGFRIFSVWAGLIAVAAVYAAGRRLLGQLGGLSAMALIAVGFWPVLLSRQVRPEAILPFLTAVILLCLSVALPIYRRRRKRGDNTTVSAALGFFLGLSVYIHPAGLLMIVFSIASILYMLRVTHQISRRRLSYLGFGILIMIIMTVPYIVSSIRHPSLGGIERLTGGDATISLESILRGFSGIIFTGDDNPLFNLPGRPLFDPFSALILLVGFGSVVIGWRKAHNGLLLLPAIVLSPVFLLSPNAPNFLNYAVILPILALLFGAGVATLHELYPKPIRRMAEAMLVLLLLVNIVWTADSLFQRWKSHPDVYTAHHGRQGELAAHIDRSSDDIPTVVCGWTVTQSPSSPTLTDAQLITLMMNRQQGANIRFVDCYNAFVFTDGGQEQQVIIPDSDVLINAHPEILFWLEDLEPLPDSTVENGMFTINSKEKLEGYVAQVARETFVDYPPEVTATNNMTLEPPFSFGGNLTLLGILPFESRRFSGGDTITMISYWRTQGMVPPDLRLFTHILTDPAASPPANTDILNLDASRLQDRDVFAQVTYIPLPDSLPQREYFVSIGAYQDTSGQRLDVLRDLDGEIGASRLFLNTVVITE
jgi:hypothetical protein